MSEVKPQEALRWARYSVRSEEHANECTPCAAPRRRSLVFIEANPFPAYSGGIENWLFNILRQLGRKGWPVKVFASTSSAAPIYDMAECSNPELIGLPPIRRFPRLYAFFKRQIPPLALLPVALNYTLWTLGAWRIIRRLVSENDVLVALHIVPAMLPLALYRFLGGKSYVVCSVRGTVGADMRASNHPVVGWLFLQLEKTVIRFAERVLSNGEDTAIYVRSELGRDCRVLPNGVDFERFARPCFSPNQNTDRWIDDLTKLKEGKTVIIMTVATLRDVKGIRFLIEAASHLKITFEGPFKIVFVGKGNPSEYENMGRSLCVDENLLFVGEQKDVSAFLRVADVGVAMFGGAGVIHAVLEMMAAGKPIVAWDNLTYSQVLTQGVSGHLVKDRDSIALATGIELLLRDQAYASRLGRMAQQAARDFDWEIVAERFLKAVGGN